jgi:BolA family transcriptional regulator, general stress-responsive regulator
MEAFSPFVLHIKDDSHLHSGHAGHNPFSETHFSVRIVSSIGRTRAAVPFGGLRSLIPFRIDNQV